MAGSPRPRRRVGASAQALVELALVSPLLVLLLLGGSQVGVIAYSQISIDTAAREGARAGVAAPNAALAWDVTHLLPGSYRCTTGDFTDGPSGNPICVAVLNADGYLDQTKFTASPCASGQACVTVQVIGPANLASIVAEPGIRLAAAERRAPSAASPCNNGNQATVNGTLRGVPAGMSARVTDSSGDSQSGVSGDFTLCVAASGTASAQTITAQIGTLGCGGYSGAVGPTSVVHGQSYSVTLNLLANPACPTPTPTATPSPTPTPLPTPSLGLSPTPTPTSGPGVTCPLELVPDTDYITVTVTYPVPVFVPLLGSLFQTQPGVRQVTSAATYAIDPCTLTRGA
jgi:TadE-like protein